MDGVIGLAPDDISNGPSFISTLKDQGVIDKKMFGLMITQLNQNQDSTITIGGYDDTQFQKYIDKDIYWYSTMNS